MKKADASILATDEPLGIIISNGQRDDDIPAMFAYVYSDAPDTSDEPLALTAV